MKVDGLKEQDRRPIKAKISRCRRPRGALKQRSKRGRPSYEAWQRSRREV